MSSVRISCAARHAVVAAKRATGFGANSNQGQIVTDIGYYLGLLVTNLNDSLTILPIPN